MQLGSALARSWDDNVIALFLFPLETLLPTNDVVSYFMAPNAEMRRVLGNSHFLFISLAFMESTSTNWKIKALWVIYEVPNDFSSPGSRKVQRVFHGSFKDKFYAVTFMFIDQLLCLISCQLLKCCE